ncbi:MAG: transcription antiterminator [Longicatena sp.]|uniref:BglG family transcription antiterminator n=1 Tax=Anaerorhabdus sp. TaxID=1872524 RepID=UPI002FC7754B
MINKRVMKIVDVLLKQDSYITIDDISLQLKVSNKTIRNDLLLVAEWLNGNNLQLIKKTGVGIKIDGSKNDKLQIKAIVNEKNKSIVDYSPEARKIFIGMQLLAFDNCRIYELSNQLYVSRATIHKDILALTNDLEIYKIVLRRKNNNGISIEGKERSMRNLLLELMLHDNGYQKFIDIVRNPDYPCDGSFVFPGLEVSDDEVHDFVACILRSGNTYINSLTFQPIVLLLLRTFISFLRIQENHFVTLSDTFISELKSEPFYNDTRQITDRLTNHYRVPFPEMEIRYLQVYFLSLQNSSDLTIEDKKEAYLISDKLIQSWSNELQLPFEQDTFLREALFTHLTPAITRFRHGIPNENPLMSEVLSQYQHTFDITKNSISCIEEHFHCHVSDDEISYLALHLATALERMKLPLRTIVVSHGGVGVSNLIVQKVSTQIPEIKIIAQETFFSIYDTDLENIDLIISTIQLNLKTTIPIIQVNSILHDYDILRIKDIILEYYKIKNDPLNYKTALHK